MTDQNEERDQSSSVSARKIYREARKLAAAQADFDVERGLAELSSAIRARANKGESDVITSDVRENSQVADGPTVLRILLGSQLRRLREARGISAKQAATAIQAPESKISRIELGRSAVREIDVLDLLTLYSVEARDREQLLTLAEQSNKPAWWHRYNNVLPDWFEAYVGMEEAAWLIRVYEKQFIPGLLQTEEYATAVFALGDHPVDQAERLVLLRKERQRRFQAGKLKLWVILDEAALRRPVGGIPVHIEQLRYLQWACSQTRLTLQVIPDECVGYAVPGGFSILRFAERDLPDVVYVENLTSALYLDKEADVRKYALAMERLACVALTPDVTPQVIDQITEDLEAALRG